MLKFKECIRFNELEIGDIFDYRTQIGVLFQVLHVTPKMVHYRPLNAPSDSMPFVDYATALGVVGLYEKKEVVNA